MANEKKNKSIVKKEASVTKFNPKTPRTLVARALKDIDEIGQEISKDIKKITEALIKFCKQKGYITYYELIEYLPEDLNPHLDYIIIRLQEMNI